MPFYFRKSVSAGPFRFNFSQGGVGMSVGVKGLRIGTGPRGHYVQGGRDGFYYRASLGSGKARRPSNVARNPDRQEPALTQRQSDGMIEVTSGDVLAMRDSAFAEVLADLNGKHQQMRMSTAFLWIGVLLVALVLAGAGANAGAVILLVPVAWLIGRWLDSFKRAAVLFYDVECQPASKRDPLSACKRVPPGAMALR